jgi:hypothetical protein
VHAVYVVERFIGALIDRHCRFGVAFFDGTLSRVTFYYLCARPSRLKCK